jgi:outer membrane protein TolC
MKKGMSYRLMISSAFLILNMSSGAQAVLDDYLVLAAENNPGLKSRFNEYLASLERIPQAGALPDPQLAFGYFIQPVETRVGPQEFKISASQMFPWFGTLKARENVAVQAAKGRYEAFEEAKSNLSHEVRTTYYDLYFNRKAGNIIEENINILESLQALALIKVESGMASPVDQYRIEMELGDLENQIALIRDRQHALEVAFFNLLNTERFKVELPEILWDRDIHLTREAILDSIGLRNHRLLELEMQEKTFRLQQDLARKQGAPNLLVGLDYTAVGKGENEFSGKDAFVFPRIGITLPLYRNKYRSMIQEASMMEAARMNQKTNRKNQLETILEQTWKDLMDADRRILLYRDQLMLAEKSIHILETEYATSNMDFEEILRMERKQLFYALELERARVGKQAAISFIHLLMGS